MKLRADEKHIEDRRMEREIRRFLEFSGERYWREKVEQQRRLADAGHARFYIEWLDLRNPFLLPLYQYFKLVDGFSSVYRNKTPELVRLVKWVFLVNRIVREGNEACRMKLLARIHMDCTTALLFELQIAAIYLMQNYEVRFTDLERFDTQSRSYDLLINDGEHEAEIECVRVSADAGRNVSRDAFYSLGDMLVRKMGDERRSFVFDIRSKERLPKRQVDLRELTRLAQRQALSGGGVAESGEFSIEVLEVPGSPRVSTGVQVQDLLKPFLSEESHIALASNDYRTLIIRVESLAQEHVVEYLYRKLKRACPQLSGEKAGVLACYVEGIENRQWRELKENSALGAIATRLMYRRERAHINMVQFVSEEVLRQSPGFVRSETLGLYFTNLNPLFDVPGEFFMRFVNNG